MGLITIPVRNSYSGTSKSQNCGKLTGKAALLEQCSYVNASTRTAQGLTRASYCDKCCQGSKRPGPGTLVYYWPKIEPCLVSHGQMRAQVVQPAAAMAFPA
eukprot:scaffold364126_cov15-Prasinocladus_malaysianus.AAC.1